MWNSEFGGTGGKIPRDRLGKGICRKRCNLKSGGPSKLRVNKPPFDAQGKPHCKGNPKTRA